MPIVAHFALFLTVGALGVALLIAVGYGARRVLRCLRPRWLPILLAAAAPTLAHAQHRPTEPVPPASPADPGAATSFRQVIAVPTVPTDPDTQPAGAPAVAPLSSDVLAARLAAIEGAVQEFKKAVGIPEPKIPPSFWDKPQGITLSIVFSIATLAVSSASSYAAVAAAGK